MTGQPKTFEMQDTMPPLPVPEVKDTLAKYLETVQPYLTSEEYATTVQTVEAALQDPEIAKRHAKLLERTKQHRNWLTRLWIDGAYMAWRAALPINSNIGGWLDGPHRIKLPQAFSAAGITLGALQYHVKLLKGEVKINMNRDKYLDMDQYSRIFSLSRVPGVELDQLVKFKPEESQHIAVCVDTAWYTIQVLDAQLNMIPFYVLHSYFDALLSKHKDHQMLNNDSVSSCSGAERTFWAETRMKMIQNATNAATVHAIESAIFPVSLEPGVDATSDDMMKTALVGPGNTRWFDKSFQLIVKEDGNPTINVEHSWADAPVPLDMFFNHACPYLEKMKQAVTPPSGAVDSNWPAPQELQWEVDSWLTSRIKEAQATLMASKKDSDMKVKQCPAVGRKAWKQAKISPDAAVQMAMQLAYRRMNNNSKPVATYETIGMTSFFEGRTECCRVVSKQSQAFVHSMVAGWDADKSETKRAAAESALRAACKQHIRYIMEGQQGKGIDRHLFGLRMMAEPGAPTPSLFTDKAFARSGGTGGFIISTSNNSYIPRPYYGGAFGSVMPNGYGIAYMLFDDYTQLVVESKYSNSETDSGRFIEHVNQSLRDIATVAGVNLMPSKL